MAFQGYSFEFGNAVLATLIVLGVLGAIYGDQRMQVEDPTEQFGVGRVIGDVAEGQLLGEFFQGDL
jgi:hypothetical protein